MHPGLHVSYLFLPQLLLEMRELAGSRGRGWTHRDAEARCWQPDPTTFTIFRWHSKASMFPQGAPRSSVFPELSLAPDTLHGPHYLRAYSLHSSTEALEVLSQPAWSRGFSWVLPVLRTLKPELALRQLFALATCHSQSSRAPTVWESLRACGRCF